MERTSPSYRVLACCAAVLLAACDDASRPTPAPHVELDLVVQPTIEGGFVITATVTNGDAPVTWSACGCRDLTLVKGPDGAVVEVRPPRGCIASCPDLPVAPGTVMRESYEFTGSVYRNGVPVPAEPGAYTVTAGFLWAGVGRGQLETRQQTFDWPGR